MKKKIPKNSKRRKEIGKEEWTNLKWDFLLILLFVAFSVAVFVGFSIVWESEWSKNEKIAQSPTMKPRQRKFRIGRPNNQSKAREYRHDDTRQIAPRINEQMNKMHPGKVGRNRYRRGLMTEYTQEGSLKSRNRDLRMKLLPDWTQDEIDLYTGTDRHNRTVKNMRPKRRGELQGYSCLNPRISTTTNLDKCYEALVRQKHYCKNQTHPQCSKTTHMKGCTDKIFDKLSHTYVATLENGVALDTYGAILNSPRIFVKLRNVIYQVQCKIVNVKKVESKICYSDGLVRVKVGMQEMFLSQAGWLSLTAVSVPCFKGPIEAEILQKVQSRKNILYSQHILSLFLFHSIESKLLLSKLFSLSSVKRLLELESEAVSGSKAGSLLYILFIYYKSYSYILITGFLIFKIIWTLTIAAIGVRKRLPVIKVLASVFGFLKSYTDLTKWTTERELADKMQIKLQQSTQRNNVTDFSILHIKSLYDELLKQSKRIQILEERRTDFDTSTVTDATSQASTNADLRTVEFIKRKESKV